MEESASVRGPTAKWPTAEWRRWPTAKWRERISEEANCKVEESVSVGGQLQSEEERISEAANCKVEESASVRWPTAKWRRAHQ